MFFLNEAFRAAHYAVVNAIYHSWRTEGDSMSVQHRAEMTGRVLIYVCRAVFVLHRNKFSGLFAAVT